MKTALLSIAISFILFSCIAINLSDLVIKLNRDLEYRERSKLKDELILRVITLVLIIITVAILTMSVFLT